MWVSQVSRIVYLHGRVLSVPPSRERTLGTRLGTLDSLQVALKTTDTQEAK